MTERKREKPAPVPKPPPRPWRRVAFSFSKDKEKASTPDRDREVTKGLEAIYLQDGTKDDLKTMSPAKRNRALRLFAWFVGFCALASALAWAGLWYFGAGSSQEASGIRLAIEGPSSIGLGREESFTISWSNPSIQPEREVELRLSVPAEMLISLISPQPDDVQNSAWKLGLVSPGTKGEIHLKGVFLGTLGTQSAIQVVATSRGEDGQLREALVTHTITYGETVLAGTFDVSAKVVAGDEVVIRYAVANRGEQGLRGLKARLNLPPGFTLSTTGTAVLQAVSGGAVYEQPLGDLAAGTTNTLRVTGVFAAGSSGDMPLKVAVGVSKQDGSFLPLLATEATLTVLTGDLGLRVVANGTDKDATLTPGDPLRITIQYKNLSPEPLSGVRLRLGFESVVDGTSATGTSLFDWDAFDDEGLGVSTTRTRVQTIVYDEESTPTLSRLDPQEEGTLDISIPTLPVPSGTKDASVRITLEGSMDRVGDDRSTRVIRTAPITFRYRSDASLDAEARFFTEEGAPMGSGPLPPQVGKTTSYRIFWNVTKSLHSLEEFQVTAVLPASVAWGAATSVQAGAITYDDATRTVRWSLNRMPENVNALEASFDIQLTPTEFDVGRFAPLLGESRFTAKDPVVNEQIVRALPPLTSDLQNDEGARNKGVVRKGE
ncbi:MAG: hypothetical protein NUW08_00410 [Candidatus Uhrbacteria bacterium]|nr:hypothetical protein [Candidatus Uhrbacteria bacterium]